MPFNNDDDRNSKIIKKTFIYLCLKHLYRMHERFHLGRKI